MPNSFHFALPLKNLFQLFKLLISTEVVCFQKFRNAEYRAAACKFGGGGEVFLGVCTGNIYLAGGNQWPPLRRLYY